MIQELYAYFIKTKYLKPTTKVLGAMKVLHEKSCAMGIKASGVSDEMKTLIEIKFLGKELSPKHRHVDNYILDDKFIIDCFIEDELSAYRKLQRLS